MTGVTPDTDLASLAGADPASLARAVPESPAGADPVIASASDPQPVPADAQPVSSAVQPEPGRVAGRALVVTASDRAAAGVYQDQAGPLLTAGLRELGFAVDGPLVVPDGEPVGEALRDAVQSQYDVVLTTGGTGLAPTDRTPELTRAVIDREVPGLAEAIRFRGTSAGIATAALSRGVAGLAGRTLIVNLPGSPGGCRDGLQVLSDVLVHAVDQIRGGDHTHAPARHSAADHSPADHSAARHEPDGELDD